MLCEEDFEVDEWAPITIESSEPDLQAVIASVDDIIEQIRGDNDYAEYVPRDRSFVYDLLLVFSHTLRTAASTSVPFTRKCALEPLAVSRKRFAKTAVEVSIGAAREAIKAWHTKHGFGWLGTWLQPIARIDRLP